MTAQQAILEHLTAQLGATTSATMEGGCLRLLYSAGPAERPLVPLFDALAPDITADIAVPGCSGSMGESLLMGQVSGHGFAARSFVGRTGQRQLEVCLYPDGASAGTAHQDTLSRVVTSLLASTGNFPQSLMRVVTRQLHNPDNPAMAKALAAQLAAVLADYLATDFGEAGSEAIRAFS